MENSFLHLVVKDILSKSNDGLDDCVVIFPNKRPLQYFIKELKDQQYSGELPLFYSIESFMDELSGAKAADPIDLLLILFRIYQKYHPQETDIDAFWGWGNLMLDDFDEIDRYMADPKALFRNLSAVKDLEKYFLQDESSPFDMLPDLMPEDEQYLKKRFLETWETYEKTYFDFKKELSSKNLAYSGMNYRLVAEKIQQGSLQTEAKKYIFIGFNAISKSEEVIIQKLIDQDKALIYWDSDKYFLDNEREESGHFIRKSMRQLRGYNEQLISNLILTDEKNIHIVAAPMQVGQAKTLGIEVQHHLENYNFGSFAIILADEKLLTPVLYAIPVNKDEINITSGYPFKYNSLATLFSNLTSLINNYQPESKSFYHKDVLAILSHPILRSGNDPELISLKKRIQKEQIIYLPLRELEKSESELIKLFFREIQDVNELDKYFNDILTETEKDTESETKIESPIKTILYDLSVLLKTHEIEISKKTYLRLFKEKLNKAITPAMNQNLEAIQLMGMLETRCLDFDTVFMLPVNEGIIPDTKRNRSYIPFDIRKNFGLPTHDEQEGLYAYNFYRLLQRSKNIYLIYNSETGSGGEEQSRYLRQIEYYFPKANPKISIHRRYYGLPLKNQQAKAIVIQKDARYFESLKAKNQTGLSPTFISSYFICQLQFYFKNILKIPEKETIIEEFEAKHFGTLFHGLMEKTFEGLKGQNVDEKVLIDRKSVLTTSMNYVLSKEHGRQKENILKKNNIAIETVKILAEKVMDADVQYSPFSLIDTEVMAEYKMPFHQNGFEEINLKGIIDRIDEKDGITRIVDYKTGRVKLNQFNYNEPDEALYNDNKEAFQTLFYGLLYLKNNPGSKLKPSIMPLRDVVNGYIDVNSKDGLFDEKSAGLFEEKLKSIIRSILDPELQILQTEDMNICQGCSYKNMCMR